MLLVDDDPGEIARTLVERVRQRRLESDLTQQGLARRAGLSLSTYRRFEMTGDVSLQNLIRIAVALGATDDFTTLFQRRRYASLDEVLAENNRSRQRGHRND
jgi:transcriptional regulator with XRE-family HTH domain